MSQSSPQSHPPGTDDISQILGRMLGEIEAAARARNFKLAEELHESLVANYPMALREIIKASGIIEDEKTAGVDQVHLALWGKLYDSLSDEERNCLYYSMKRHVLRPKTMILTHGQVNNRLFLIERGQVTIFFKKDGKSYVLAQLGPGDILGEYTFSTISLCSASAITHTEVQLMCLESKAADGWEDRFPGLYEKLIDFCMKEGKVDEILRNKKLEKRTHLRFPASGRVKAVLLTKDGGKSDVVFGGGLSDISVSGACFSMRCAKKSTARALLARHLFLVIAGDQEQNPATISTGSRVVRVSFHLYGDFSVHVHFDKELTEEVVRKFAN